MNSYKLDIELFFASSSGMEDITDTCLSLMQGITEEKCTKLNQSFESQVKTTIENIRNIAQEIIKERAGVIQLVQEANNSINQLRQIQSEIPGLFDELERQYSSKLSSLKEREQNIGALIDKTNTTVDGLLKNLNTFDEAIKTAKQCAESAQFLSDMLKVNGNIVTGGKIVAQEKGRHGYEVIKSWEL